MYHVYEIPTEAETDINQLLNYIGFYSRVFVLFLF